MPDIFDQMDDGEQSASGSGQAPEPEPSPIPRFIRQGVDMSKVSTVQRQTPRPGIIADVNPLTPHTVNVSRPDLYSPGVANHELTHVYQMTRDTPLSSGKIPDYIKHPLSKLDYSKDYAYGGENGLLSAQSKGKKASDFTVEQQGEMVKDYSEQQRDMLYRAKGEPLAPFTLKAFEKTKQAYHPYIQSLANLPGEKGGGYDINARPPAPGLPPADTPGLGVLQADPLMAGYSVPLPTPSQKNYAKSVAWPKHTSVPTKTR